MRGAINDRGEADGKENSFLPGIPVMMQRRNRQNGGGKQSQLRYLLFADDRTILSGAAQIGKVREQRKMSWAISKRKETTAKRKT